MASARMAAAIVSVSASLLEREFCWVLQVRVDYGVDTEFPYRVRIVDRGVDCRDPVCRHRFRFPDFTPTPIPSLEFSEKKQQPSLFK